MTNVSLYQRVLAAIANPPVIIHPAAFEALVEAIVDALIEQQIAATLTIKLPTEEAWKTYIQRYKQQFAGLKQIYLCRCFQSGEAIDNSLKDSLIPVYLADDNQLRYESFFLVLSEQLCGIVIAHPSEISSDLLQVICTFERQIVQQVIESLKSVLTITDDTPEDLLIDWDIQLPETPDPALLTQIIAKQAMVYKAGDRRQTYPQKPVAPIPSSSSYSSNFIKHIAQELRTPITHMKTALKLVESPSLKVEQRQRYLRLLHQECDRQNSFLAGLLELVELNQTPQPTRLTSLQLANIVPGIVSTYQPLAQEKGISLGYTIATGLPAVFCLETWLRQIVINLLNNSLKYTPSGGKVLVQANQKGEYVQLVFQDTGVGIAPTDISRIFDSFYRGRSTEAEEIIGAGLGLTIVQEILQRCGGSISVTSELNKGSMFKLLLPISVNQIQRIINK